MSLYSGNTRRRFPVCWNSVRSAGSFAQANEWTSTRPGVAVVAVVVGEPVPDAAGEQCSRVASGAAAKVGDLGAGDESDAA